MDMIMVDVTGVDSVSIGDEVELWGENIRIEEVAKASNTIPYQLLTGVSARVERVYTYKNIDEDSETELKESTRQVLGNLTAREAKALRTRFGLTMDTDHTLEDVGKQFDVERKRIRDIEQRLRNLNGDPDDEGPDTA